MEALTAVVITLLLLSLAANAALVWYVRRILPPYTTVSENFATILTQFQAYRTHLESVYQMELFYGDDTLKGLLKHTLAMVNYLKTFSDVYSFTNPNLDQELEEDVTEEQEQDEEPKEETRPKKVQKILYQSP